MEHLLTAIEIVDDQWGCETIHLLTPTPLEDDQSNGRPVSPSPSDLDWFEQLDSCLGNEATYFDPHQLDALFLPDPFPLLDLPQDLIGLVVEYADMKSRCRLACSNKYLRRLVLYDMTWIWPSCHCMFSPRTTQRVHVKEPGAFDILVGRGARSNRHEGNKIYRRVIRNKREEYKAKNMSKQDKTKMARNMLTFLVSRVGRFVKQDRVNGDFYILTEKEARRKVSQLLRDSTPLKWI